MQIQPFSALFPDAQPFVVFDVAIKGQANVKCIGHDYYCCNDKCNCHLTNIMVYAASSGGSGELLTRLHYGWRNKAFYLRKGFYPLDVKGMVLGDIPLDIPQDELAKGIVLAFRAWLKQDTKEKIKLFSERYQMFKTASKGMYSEEQEGEDIFNALLLAALFDWDKK